MMPKNRMSIPRAVREQVEREFNHRCAICGTDKPHLHHIDENPANNEPLNLIPLCPNCHLTDQHNPTKMSDSKLLRLFREFKDPMILKPQFYPLFVRLEFLNEIVDASDADTLEAQASELVDFISVLAMGAFYSKKIKKLTHRTRYGSGFILGDPSSEYRHAQQRKQQDTEYCTQLRNVREQIVALSVELLRFQNNWK